MLLDPSRALVTTKRDLRGTFRKKIENKTSMPLSVACIFELDQQLVLGFTAVEMPLRDTQNELKMLAAEHTGDGGMRIGSWLWRNGLVLRRAGSP